MHILIGLIIAFLLVLVLSNRSTRQCKWRMDRARDLNGQSYFRCLICGADCFTIDGKPPKLCQSKQPPPDL